MTSEGVVSQVNTVIWRGPVGEIEFKTFYSGTQATVHAVAVCEDFTLSGGGDTIAAIEKFPVAGQIDYISTAGEAFLEHVQGRGCRRWLRSKAPPVRVN